MKFSASRTYRTDACCKVQRGARKNCSKSFKIENDYSTIFCLLESVPRSSFCCLCSAIDRVKIMFLLYSSLTQNTQASLWWKQNRQSTINKKNGKSNSIPVHYIHPCSTTRVPVLVGMCYILSESYYFCFQVELQQARARGPTDIFCCSNSEWNCRRRDPNFRHESYVHIESCF